MESLWVTALKMIGCWIAATLAAVGIVYALDISAPIAMLLGVVSGCASVVAGMKWWVQS